MNCWKKEPNIPTEHEFKYLINLDLLSKYYPSELKDMADEVQYIRQGYLAFSKGMTTRIRCVTDNKQSRWYLTFKQKVSNRVIEIEKKLDGRDGSDLWDVCVGKLSKERHIFVDHGYNWELDLFLKGESVYFILAEVELAEGSARPKTAPKFLKNFILHEVCLTDDRFSNKRLGDIDYAQSIYKEFK